MSVVRLIILTSWLLALSSGIISFCSEKADAELLTADGFYQLLAADKHSKNISLFYLFNVGFLTFLAGQLGLFFRIRYSRELLVSGYIAFLISQSLVDFSVQIGVIAAINDVTTALAGALIAYSYTSNIDWIPSRSKKWKQPKGSVNKI